MAQQDNQGIFLDELARRWRLETDRIIDLAIDGELPLWIGFADVYVQKAEAKPTKARARQPAVRTRLDTVELRPAPEVLAQIRGRCDRMLIAAELACLDDKGKPVILTNSVGEEWGETSMIGLKPAALFARPHDVARYERKNKVKPYIVRIEEGDSVPTPAPPAPVLPTQEHPWFAPELHAATTCWQALFAEAHGSEASARKADILAWLARHHPELSRTALERIAQVVTPAKKGRR